MRKITKEQDEILGKHRKWLDGDGEGGGERADLAGADLACANLAANPAGADLTARADLSHNDNVIGCTLTNYQMFAFMQQGELRFTCGCHRGLTLEEAREHWSPERRGKWEVKRPEWGEQRQRQVDFLLAEAVHLGWIKGE